MQWKGRRESDNVRDSRGETSGRGIGGGGLSLLMTIGRVFGIKGILAAIVVGAVLWEVGLLDPWILGTSDKVAALRNRPDYNEYSVRLELQADFYAGVWAAKSAKYLDHGDIEEAMRAANAIGDDAIQKKMQGRVVPHSFTHGTSEQRMRWFNKGLRSGKIEDGDSFSMPYSQL